MTGSREVITGGDFKRMVSGAYSEFLLEYETINALGGAGTLAGTHILRTMGAAVMPLADAKDDSIGGLARRVSTAAVFGARGNAGVVLAQMFRGISAGLVGKYEATGSEFGKAFQYGILYAQRLVPEEPDRPFITVAKAVAKGAYHAVRDGMPIVEILYQAIQSGEVAVNEMEHGDAGANIMLSFLKGCLKGLDGNFVSPAVSLSLGLGTHKNMPDPRNDLVRPYCIRLRIKNSKASLPELERQMRDFASFSIVERARGGLDVHVHTDHVGKTLEQAIGWGPLSEINITNMSEAHALPFHEALMKVAALAVAKDSEEAQKLQDAGASILVSGSAESSPSLAEIIGAAHSDLASSYVLVASSPDYRLVFRQAKRLLGGRVELVLADTFERTLTALQKFSPSLSALENSKIMSQF
ncbi:MAG: DAK2 domain-containing protein [Selenomonadaceae bacterium]|nr:DAK2 domain-containing protein [Selenomonadaceae bacterium]MBR3498538.1 DAK2 domain-containing protein [Selenomonadaceae bacterium]